MLPRIYSIVQRNVNSCVVVSSRFCTYYEEPTYIKIERNEEKNLENLGGKKKKVDVITCRQKEFNHFHGQSYPKFQPLPLASGKWHLSKLKGDYFTIHPIEEVNKEPKQKEDEEEMSFKDLGVSDELLANLQSAFDIDTPTTIQKMGIPAILAQQNVKLLAETGCGKTLAYLLPLVEQILNWKNAIDRPFNHPLALIITPSRELALQIGRAVMRLTKDLEIRTKVIVGGGIKNKIFNPPASNVDIIVASFGALSKHTTIGLYKMKYVRHVVLDEVDSLFDETFYDKFRHFLRKISFGPLRDFADGLPKYSQLTMVAATMPQFIEEMLDNIVDPSSLQEIATDNVHRVFVTQKFLRLGVQQKPMTLLRLIKNKAKNKTSIIIFCNNSKTCDFVSQFLHEFEVKCARLNGAMPLRKRRNVFMEFQTGIYNVLCTTDAGSRGLDTVAVKDVINYDFPLQTFEYIHRCGRTARVRSPRDCRVFNFIARPLEILLAQKIEKAIKMDKPLPMVDYLKRNWILEKEDEKELMREQGREREEKKGKFKYFSEKSSKDSDVKDKERAENIAY